MKNERKAKSGHGAGTEEAEGRGGSLYAIAPVVSQCISLDLSLQDGPRSGLLVCLEPGEGSLLQTEVQRDALTHRWGNGIEGASSSFCFLRACTMLRLWVSLILHSAVKARGSPPQLGLSFSEESR